MKKSRLFATLLAVLMLLSIISGCGTAPAGGSSAPADGSPAKSEPATDAPAPDSQPGATPDEGAQPEPDAEPSLPEIELPLTTEENNFSLFIGMNPNAMQFRDSMEEFLFYQELEKRTGVHISITPMHPASQVEQLMMMLSSGDYADLFSSLGMAYMGKLSKAVEDGVVINIMDYAELCPHYLSTLNSDEMLLKDCVLDSGAVGAFYCVYKEKTTMPGGPMLRSDWLEQLGMDLPRTYDQYYEMLKSFKTEYGATMWLPSTGLYPSNYFLQNGYNMVGSYITGFQTSLQCFYQEDGVVKCGFLEDGFKDWLAMMGKWYGEGLIDPDYISGTPASQLNSDPDSLGKLTSGKYGLWCDQPEAITIYQAADPDFGCAPAYYATKNEGDRIKVGYYTSRLNVEGYSISTTCKDIELLVRWADYAYTEEGSELASWGVQDVTYTVDQNGNKRLTDLILNNPEGMSSQVATSVYLGAGGQSFIYDRDRDRSIFTEQQLLCDPVWNENYDCEWTLPNISFTTEESESEGLLTGDIITYVSEAINKFVTGELTAEKDYSAFVQTLKELGIEQMVKNRQAAYERWQNK